MPILFMVAGGSKTGYAADEFSDTKKGTFLLKPI